MRIRAGYRITYDCPGPTPMLMMLSIRPERAPDLESPDFMLSDPYVPIRTYVDAFGNICTRLVAPAGRTTFHTDFVIPVESTRTNPPPPAKKRTDSGRASAKSTNARRRSCNNSDSGRRNFGQNVRRRFSAAIFCQKRRVETTASRRRIFSRYNSTTIGTKLELYDCNGVGGQKWVPQANGSLLNPQSGLCLDDPSGNTTNGTQLQIYTCNGNSSQKWTYEPDGNPGEADGWPGQHAEECGRSGRNGILSDRPDLDRRLR